MPLCEKPSLVVSIRGIKKSNYSQWSCEWPKLKFHWLWVVSSTCLKNSHHQVLKKLHLKHIFKTCSSIGTVSYFATNLSVRKGSCNICCIAGVQWRSSSPDWRFCVQRILCPMKITSFQFSESTWKFFLSRARTRCSISFPLVPNRSSTNR